MSETSKPSKPVRRKPLPTEADSAGVPKPALAKTKVARPKVRPAAETDDDEFANVPTRLPPQVMGKKKKPKKREMSREEAEYEAAAAPKPRSEYLIPFILIGIGLIANVLVSMMLREEGMPVGLWLGIRMGIIVASMIITYGALFLCAAVLDADYGYLDVGAVKVAAICLTQGWVGDLAAEIPIPFLGSIIAFLVSYAMFKCFFELGEMEVFYSMFIVRIVHWVVVIFAFVALMTAIMGGKHIAVPGLDGADDEIMEPEDAGIDDPAGAKGLEDPEEMEP